MRISLATRAARACAAAALVFSLGPAPSYARMGGASFARPGPGFGHFQHFAPRGFNRRFGFDRFGFNRFGFDRFDRFRFNRFDRFGFNRFNRFRRFGDNPLGVGSWGWGGCGWDGWGGVPVSTGASQPIIVGAGAPVIINVGADPKPSSANAADAGGCVIHKLIYDSNGKYVGERQRPQC